MPMRAGRHVETPCGLDRPIALTNDMLMALTHHDRVLLVRHSSMLVLKSGPVPADVTRQRILFPMEAILTLNHILPSGKWAMMAMIGHEGMADCRDIAELTGQHSLHCLVGGTVRQVSMGTLQAVADQSAELRRLISDFNRVLTAQLVGTIAGVSGSVAMRVARLLLMIDDRMPGKTICLTHDRLADALGVRRASVTDALHLLEGSGLLRSCRNAVELRNRMGLSAVAGASYSRPEGGRTPQALD